MRDKNFNTGVRGVLLDAGHYERMGSAIWLYSWLVLRQTHQSGSIGWVLGGSPVSYREIEEETGFNRRTLEGWFRRLRREGYIETTAAPTGVVVRITKAKKYSQTTRRIAERLRQGAATPTPNCVATDPQNAQIQQFPARMVSSSVERIKDKEKQSEIHRNLHREIHKSSVFLEENPSGLEEATSQASADRDGDAILEAERHEQLEEIRSRVGGVREHYSYNAREFLELLRAKRDEAVRRELQVGTGPEVRRA
jgi:DNA-binding transcriptional regulator YhcF (GntR family)